MQMDGYWSSVRQMGGICIQRMLPGQCIDIDQVSCIATPQIFCCLMVCTIGTTQPTGSHSLVRQELCHVVKLPPCWPCLALCCPCPLCRGCLTDRCVGAPELGSLAQQHIQDVQELALQGEREGMTCRSISVSEPVFSCTMPSEFLLHKSDQHLNWLPGWQGC
jgi:hypothetical protein